MSEGRNEELIKFKHFINKHPKLIREIRKNGKSWQEAYEQWVLLGEEDIHWGQYKDDVENEEEKKEEDKKYPKIELNNDIVKQIMKYAESMDINKLQDQVHQLSKTIRTIQEVVEQFQGANKKTPEENHRGFGWFND